MVGSSARSYRREMFSWFRRPREIPTLLHFTHAKAGSTWIDGILRHLFGAKVVPRFGADLFPEKPGNAASPPAARISYAEMFRQQPFRPGHVYPGLFLTREEFELRPEFADSRRFIVIPRFARHHHLTLFQPQTDPCV